MKINSREEFEDAFSRIVIDLSDRAITLNEAIDDLDRITLAANRAGIIDVSYDDYEVCLRSNHKVMKPREFEV